MNEVMLGLEELLFLSAPEIAVVSAEEHGYAGGYGTVRAYLRPFREAVRRMHAHRPLGRSPDGS
ncbi:hypothetical protein [Streptomyces platensis]|uniref:hypothetical protein n=1 Tax=Streptomyces platensis TaxID=58346 RepID=UPI0038695801|nr:hypothetical protein OG962_36630 [Streptomyces platensis]